MATVLFEYFYWVIVRLSVQINNLLLVVITGKNFFASIVILRCDKKKEEIAKKKKEKRRMKRKEENMRADLFLPLSFSSFFFTLFFLFGFSVLWRKFVEIFWFRSVIFSFFPFFPFFFSSTYIFLKKSFVFFFFRKSYIIFVA